MTQTTPTCEFCDSEPTCYDDDGFFVCQECKWENEKEILSATFYEAEIEGKMGHA